MQYSLCALCPGWSQPQVPLFASNLPSRSACSRSRGARAHRILRHRLADDIDLHFHPQLVLRTSCIGAGERNCLARITRDRDADEIAVSDDAIGGIEFDPAGARQIDLAPCVGRAAADIFWAVTRGNV